jgi:DNA polymerase
LALTASKKFAAALIGANSVGRLRGQFQFYGAHTGRWSGRGVQLQNLPRKGLESQLLVDEAILTLKLGERVDPQTLKCLVRPLLVGPFTVFDYASIEARVIAWLAGEKWALDAFRLGRDIYVETAERMSTPTRPLTRFQGKVAVLALGFAGGVNSLRAMGAEGTKEELGILVRQWRNANPKIVQFWAEVDEAISSGGTVGKHVSIKHTRNRRGVTMHVRLPSGRSLNYHGVKWERYRVKDHDTKKMVSKEGWTYLDPRGMGRIGTYGGRMTENIVQAVARDVMAEAMVVLEEKGFQVVGTVHDELIIEGAHDIEVVHSLMCRPPAWCPDLPIEAEGGHLPRYSK